MAKIIIDANNRLTANQLESLLSQVEARSSLGDDLLSLLRQLVTFEQRYELPSDLFYARFMRGDMGDALDFIKWAGRYELYLETQQALEAKLTQRSITRDTEELSVSLV